MTRTVSRIQRHPNHPYSLPSTTDYTDVLQVYQTSTPGNFVIVDRTDANVATLPSTVTSAPNTNQTVDPLYDLSGRKWNNCYSLQSTPITLTRSMFGMNGVATTDSDLNLTNLGFLRLIDGGHFEWDAIELVAGTYNSAKLTQLDSVINTANASGVEVIYCIQRSAAVYSRALSTVAAADLKLWLPAATRNTSSSVVSTVDLTPLTNFINMLLNRYGAKLTAIEGWNEPCVSGSYLDTAGISGLVSYNNAIYNAITAYNAANSTSIKFVGFTNTGWDGQAAATTYGIPNLVTAGGFTNCHAFGYHIYKGGGQSPFTTPVNMMRNLTALLTANSLGALPLWITEFGNSNTPLYYSDYKIIMRELIWLICLGAKKVSPYSWSDKGLGDMRFNQVKSAWDTAISLMSGKTLNFVNVINSNTLVASIDGVIYEL